MQGVPMRERDSSELPLIPRDSSRQTLKYQDTFLVCSATGDVRSGARSEEGLYMDGTRFLSYFQLVFDGMPPVLLGSHVRDQNDSLNVTETNDETRSSVAKNTVAIRRHLFLFEESCYITLELENFSRSLAECELVIRFGADYADIFEVRGMPRSDRGQQATPIVGADSVELGYIGLDDERRWTSLAFSPRPRLLEEHIAKYDIVLARRESISIQITVRCGRAGRSHRGADTIESAREKIVLRQLKREETDIYIKSSNRQFTEWCQRSRYDLNLLLTEMPTGLYPYAGVPWFNTPFGRDGLVTALECLWMQPGIAKGVLAYLAETQATEVIPEEDAEPGKILHEIRNGEMAAIKEMPFGRYYGSVDATPLFVLLVGAYYERTGDLPFIRKLWPSVRASLKWMESHGDLDRDGYIEYKRQASTGLLHQGWKDSDDAVFHADGTVAQGPIALCEVQGYAYAAWRAGAMLAQHLEYQDICEDLTGKAERLREWFNREFWCAELSTYGLALDGQKQLCRVKSSNAGQCLFSGIATPEHARQIGDTLLKEDSCSGWGIRTVASTSSRYNPMSYHNGSIWPHDNALIALGMARYGLMSHVSRLSENMFASASYFDRYRLPELFCGFDRAPGVAPVLYPVACAPQSWTAASVFLLIQASLGLRIDGLLKQISLTRPTLPNFLEDIEICNLPVGGDVIELSVRREGENVMVETNAEAMGYSFHCS